MSGSQHAHPTDMTEGIIRDSCFVPIYKSTYVLAALHLLEKSSPPRISGCRSQASASSPLLAARRSKCNSLPLAGRGQQAGRRRRKVRGASGGAGVGEWLMDAVLCPHDGRPRAAAQELLTCVAARVPHGRAWLLATLAASEVRPLLPAPPPAAPHQDMLRHPLHRTGD